MPEDHAQDFARLEELAKTKEELEAKIFKELGPQLSRILRETATTLKSREPHASNVYIYDSKINGRAVYRESDIKDASEESKLLTKAFAGEVRKQLGIPEKYVSAEIDKYRESDVIWRGL